MQRFRDGHAPLPRDARQLGGRLNEGIGEYYRQVLAPQRTLERAADENWVARWSDHGHADPWGGASVSSGLGSAGASIGHHASVSTI